MNCRANFGISTLPTYFKKVPHVYINEPAHSHTKKVNQYVMIKKIGQGFNAKVYLAFNTESKKSYAAKTIRLSHKDSKVQTLIREIQLMRSLSHKNIIQFHEVLHDYLNQNAYIIMEYADCGSLQNLIDENFHFSESDLASTFIQILEALIYLHEHGIVHQDIKPSNILFLSSGLVKLADFGIGHSFASAEQVVGTPAYQAPELFIEPTEIEPSKMDIYSLGVTLFQTITGKLPYNGENVYEIAHIAETGNLKLPDDISPTLADLLQKMITPNPSKRLSSFEAIQHPFFKNAPQKIQILPHPMAHPTISSSQSFEKISAHICDETYQFHVPSNSNYLFSM